VLESEKREEEKDLAGAAKTHLGLAHWTIRCARLNSSEQATLGKLWQCTIIIHRTVRWCTRLSGEPTAASATVICAIRGRRVARSNGRLGHRTVSCAPTSPELQRSVEPETEGNRTPDMNSGCPVVHRTARCTTRQKARIAFQDCLQRLLAALRL
jgi:hypothetical protein